MLARQGYPSERLIEMAGGDTREQLEAEERYRMEEEMKEQDRQGYRELVALAHWIERALDMFGLEGVEPIIDLKPDTAFLVLEVVNDLRVEVGFHDGSYRCELWGVTPGRPGYSPELFLKRDYATANVSRAAIKCACWLIVERWDTVVEIVSEEYQEIMLDDMREQD